MSEAIYPLCPPPAPVLLLLDRHRVQRYQLRGFPAGRDARNLLVRQTRMTRREEEEEEEEEEEDNLRLFID